MTDQPTSLDLDERRTIWRPRDSRGHYLPNSEPTYSLEPYDWDDTCRHTGPAATELAPSSETFGHEPVIGFVDGRALSRVCARCSVTKRAPGLCWPASVRWPCTSAVVLGLSPARPAAARTTT